MAEKRKPDSPQEPKGPRKDSDENFDWRRAGRTLAFWIFLILVVIVISTYLGPSQEEANLIDYSNPTGNGYKEYLEANKFTEAVITERDFVGTLTTPDEKGNTQVRTVLPFISDEVLAQWEEKGLNIEFKAKATNWIGMLLTSILPWIILIGLWLFFMRRMTQGASRGIFTFGKSKAKLMTEEKSKVTFEDVAGGDEAKEELQEIIQFLKEPKKFQRLGGRIPKGALLVGPPGTGKTLMARAVAGEAAVPFFSMSGADFVEMFVGVGASRVRDLFEQGKRHAPCIIFIDEIDAVGRQRGAGLGGGHDEREQTLNQLLVEMDGFESNEGVILIAATNRPDVLDPALLRPGRFDRQIVVDRPDVRGREGIFKVHTKAIPLASKVDLKILAKGTPGLSGADIANLVNEAALLAARRNGTKVGMGDFEDAKDKVMMGTERRSMLISDEEKKLTAYHEAGHVLVAKLTPGSDPVHKVTIIPRGRALGVTHYLPIDEKHTWSKHYIENKMVHLMGGRAAEVLVFEDYTNGAASDIKQATAIARRMVCEWGMSEKIGPLALTGGDQEIFLGRDFAQTRDYSEATALEVDREVKRLVVNGQNKAMDLLKNNMDKLHKLSRALLDREILDGEEIEMVMKDQKLPKIGKSRAVDEADEADEAASETADGKRSDTDRLREVDKVLEQMKDDDSADKGKAKLTDKAAKKSDDKPSGGDGSDKSSVV
jgi:cell division protease FtsH